MSADNSFATRNRILASRTLALFHRNNPTAKELGANILDESTYLVRSIGGMHNIIQPPTNPRIDEPGCGCEAAAPAATCTSPASFEITINQNIGVFDPPYNIYNNLWEVTWDPVSGATSYTVTSTEIYATSLLIVYTGGTTANIYTDGMNYGDQETITVTALNDCDSSTATSIVNGPCFLAGSLVAMADGTQTVIEEIVVGDLLLGAFGEINTVLALHRPLLGSYYMVHINGDHYTSAHHPHITADKQFVCVEPAVVDNETYGREHTVINAQGQEELRMLHGLNKGRVQQLAVGATLKTVEGSRLVETLLRADMPPETQLYNLVIGGSHTYHVDGYAVTGWPREDDFNYDAWKPRGEPVAD
jgi:hypothetical protein